MAMREERLEADTGEESMFAVGEEAYAYDMSRSVWCLSTIKAVQAAGHDAPAADVGSEEEEDADRIPTQGGLQGWKYYVHYKNWSAKWDIWLDKKCLLKLSPANAETAALAYSEANSVNEARIVGAAAGQVKANRQVTTAAHFRPPLSSRQQAACRLEQQQQEQQRSKISRSGRSGRSSSSSGSARV